MENNVNYSETDYIADNRLKLLSYGKLRTEDGCVFDVHKFVLAKSSKYFNASFCGLGKDKDDILIPGIKSDILHEILSFIYSGKVSLRDETVSELMIAADYLLLDNLLSHILIILKMNLSAENCLLFYTAAQGIKRRDILGECYRYVQTHFEYILHSSDVVFGELSLESMKQFLSDRNLYVSSEKTAFSAIVKWVAVDKPKRQCFVPDLLVCLAADDINDDLASIILEDDVVLNNPFCQFILDAKWSSPHADNFEILQHCLYDPSRLAKTNVHQRLPTKLHCIAFYSACDTRHIVQFHVSYDENIDLWRKVLEIEFVPKYVACVDNSIYMFRRGDSINFRYSLIEDKWYELDQFIIPRRLYVIAVVDGKIYALGDISDISGDEIYDVEIYDPELDIWYHKAPPMISLFAFCAVSLDRSIYVVGSRFNFEEYEMVAQVYYTTAETWDLLPAVSVSRSHFALIAYREKVYVIGGIHDGEVLKDVEMFDPEKNEWTAQPPLPYAYNVPKAVVVNDVLIVHDNHREDHQYMKTYPPVFWNTQSATWERFEESSPMNYLYLYQFLTFDNKDSIASFTISSRKSGTFFEKSPFA